MLKYSVESPGKCPTAIGERQHSIKTTNFWGAEMMRARAKRLIEMRVDA